ncbi:MAG: hypothetical protein ACRCZS_19305 [Chroococcidiopsis sp.]
MKTRTLGKITPTGKTAELSSQEQELFDVVRNGCYVIDIPKTLYTTKLDLYKKLKALEDKELIERTIVDVAA